MMYVHRADIIHFKKSISLPSHIFALQKHMCLLSSQMPYIRVGSIILVHGTDNQIFKIQNINFLFLFPRQASSSFHPYPSILPSFLPSCLPVSLTRPFLIFQSKQISSLLAQLNSVQLSSAQLDSYQVDGVLHTNLSSC